MTIDKKSKDEKIQYDINREAAKISLLSSGEIDKYEKCIIDTSGTLLLLVTFQFINRIPATFKIFTYTPKYFYEPHSY